MPCPERRQELTTEGGLDIVSSTKDIAAVIKKLKAAGITVSVFVDPDKKQIEAAADSGADCVELHTGKYAEAFAKTASFRRHACGIQKARSGGKRCEGTRTFAQRRPRA